jgi:hypothetical protein
MGKQHWRRQGRIALQPDSAAEGGRRCAKEKSAGEGCWCEAPSEEGGQQAHLGLLDIGGGANLCQQLDGSLGLGQGLCRWDTNTRPDAAEVSRQR